jgi:thiamine-phosphate pyrophosphorylase
MGPVICMVTDRRAYGDGWEDALVRRVGAAARAGVHLIQVRERGLDARDYVQLVSRCVREAAGTHARVIVNDRLDVALSAGAHGLHLPTAGILAARVRTAVTRDFVIGRSVHSAAEAADAAQQGGLDYLIFGTVFPTASKPGVVPAGVDGLRAACRAVSLPVLAIGGVTLDRARAVARAGAGGFAGIGLFQAASEEEARKTVQHANALFDTLRDVER